MCQVKITSFPYFFSKTNARIQNLPNNYVMIFYILHILVPSSALILHVAFRSNDSFNHSNLLYVFMFFQFHHLESSVEWFLAQDIENHEED